MKKYLWLITIFIMLIPTMVFGQKTDGDTDSNGQLDSAFGGTNAEYLTECAVIENLAAADDDFEIFMANDPITITGIGLHCSGTCTIGADISLEDRAGNAMTHTVPTHSTGSENTTFQAVTAANTLVAGEALRFDVDNAVDPETDTYTICFTYTIQHP